MDDPTKLNKGDIIIVSNVDYPGVGMVVDIEDHPDRDTIIVYRRLMNEQCRTPRYEEDSFRARIKNVELFVRKQAEMMFEKAHNEINAMERIISDAYFDGMDYFDCEQNED